MYAAEKAGVNANKKEKNICPTCGGMMITKHEWDIIAKCLAHHPSYIDNDEVNDLLAKLSELTDCEKEHACYV